MKVRSKSVLYGALQKQQKSNFTKVPVGSEGVLCVRDTTWDGAIEYCLVKFGRLWVRCSPAVLEEIGL